MSAQRAKHEMIPIIGNKWHFSYWEWSINDLNYGVTRSASQPKILKLVFTAALSDAWYWQYAMGIFLGPKFAEFIA